MLRMDWAVRLEFSKLNRIDIIRDSIGVPPNLVPTKQNNESLDSYSHKDHKQQLFSDNARWKVKEWHPEIAIGPKILPNQNHVKLKVPLGDNSFGRIRK